MSLIAVWIDREHAKLFDISDIKMERKVIHARHVEHHTHSIDGLDQANFEKKYFDHVKADIESASKILILGPGIVKFHFQKYLAENFPMISKRVVGCETVDHPTDHQIAELARKYFKLDLMRSD